MPMLILVLFGFVLAHSENLDSARPQPAGIAIGLERDTMLAKAMDVHLQYPQRFAQCVPCAHISDGRIDSLSYIPRNARIHDEIGDLTNLRYLSITCSDTDTLTHVPRQLGELRHLTYLRISDCGLSDLPGELGQLQLLRTLDLRGNAFTAIPGWIFKLKGLQVLNLTDNKLSQVDGLIRNLTRLSTLKLDRNRLQSLPNEVMKLSLIDTFWIGDNRLRQENLDTTLVAWLERKTKYWRMQATQKDLRGFIQQLGKAYLNTNSIGRIKQYQDPKGYMPSSTMMGIPTANIEAILAKADSQSLSTILQNQSKRDSDRVSPQEMVRGLLSAYEYCKTYPELLNIIGSYFSHEYPEGTIMRHNRSIDSLGHAAMADHIEAVLYLQILSEINLNLAWYVAVNEAYFKFWGERHKDKSIEGMARIIQNIRHYCYPALLPDSVSVSDLPNANPSKAAYIAADNFFDVEGLDFHTGFKYRDELMLHYLAELYPGGIWGAEKKISKGPRLWQTLLSLRSPYFDSTLLYFGLYQIDKRRHFWKETQINPSLSVKWRPWEEDSPPYTLFARLNLSTREKKQPKIIVGLPKTESITKNKKPTGYYMSKRISTVRKPWQDTSLVIIEKNYDFPKEISRLKSLRIEDRYLWEWGYVYNPIPDSIIKTISSKKSYPDAKYILMQSTLSAVFDSGDSTILNRFQSFQTFGDGHTGWHEPHTSTPQFADLDGDGRYDLFVETSAGTRFFNQTADGFFEKR